MEDNSTGSWRLLVFLCVFPSLLLLVFPCCSISLFLFLSVYEPDVDVVSCLLSRLLAATLLSTHTCLQSAHYSAQSTHLPLISSSTWNYSSMTFQPFLARLLSHFRLSTSLTFGNSLLLVCLLLFANLRFLVPHLRLIFSLPASHSQPVTLTLISYFST